MEGVKAAAERAMCCLSGRILEAKEYDLVVIGSGPAGQKEAICAAKLRKKVAIVDKKRTIGGVCVHTGTIPSKTLRQAVLYLSGFRQRAFYGRSYVVKDGISMADLIFGAQAVMSREIEVMQAHLQRNGVSTLEGAAHFVDAHTVEVKEVNHILLVGSRFLWLAARAPRTQLTSTWTVGGFWTPTSYSNSTKYPEN